MNELDHAPSRRLRTPFPWFVLFFVLPALLLALLVALLLPAPPAQAATLTVCASGGTYTTIAAAVAAAQAGDVIEICAGDYAESVDLYGMYQIGDLTLRGTGTVVITPTTGPALFVSNNFSGNLTLDNLAVWSADASAISLTHPITGNLTLVSVLGSDAAGNGIEAIVWRTVVISGSSFLDNGGHGAEFRGYGQVTAQDSLFSGNGQGPGSAALPVAGSAGLVVIGLPNYCSHEGIVALDGVTAADNSGPGVFLQYANNGVRVSHSTFTRNGGGLYVFNDVACGDPVELDDVTATDNLYSSLPTPAHGIFVAAQRVRIANVTATGNTGMGVLHLLAPPAFTGQLAPAAVNAGNDPGYPPSSVHITNTTALHNLLDGFNLDAAEYVTLTNVSAISNVVSGIALSVTNPIVLPLVAATAAYDSAATTTQGDIGNALVLSNAVGVWINDITQPIAASGSDGVGTGPNVSVHSSIICRNTGAGVAASGNFSSTYAAPVNFWGSLTGPTSPRNASGTGDAVVDATYGEGNGYVAFTPFINDVAYTADTDPLIVGGDNEFYAWYFTSGTWQAMGEGPGNLNDAGPFTLAVENGQATTQWGTGAFVAAGINPNGVVTATVNPTASGPLTVTLTDPCGASTILDYNAVAPVLVVTKRPALQTVLPGSTVTFTVDLTNTGTLPLKNILVTDTLAPGCSTSYDELLPEATEQITCTQGPVSADFTNVVTVTANPIQKNPCGAGSDSAQCALGPAAVDAGSVPPDQVVVTATASADVDVVVPALTAAKTAGTDANACAQPGPITVPTGSSVYYCLRLTNSGDVTLTHHIVSDPLLGVFNLPLTYTLAPGANLPITRSLIPALGPIAVTAPITNVFAVTSTGLITQVGGVVVPPVPVSVQSTANVEVRTPSTGLPPGQEPFIDNYLFLPALKK